MLFFFLNLSHQTKASHREREADESRRGEISRRDEYVLRKIAEVFVCFVACTEESTMKNFEVSNCH